MIHRPEQRYDPSWKSPITSHHVSGWGVLRDQEGRPENPWVGHLSTQDSVPNNERLVGIVEDPVLPLLDFVVLCADTKGGLTMVGTECINRPYQPYFPFRVVLP